MRRKRGQVSNAEQLLRLLLMHVAGGLSLGQTVARAQARNLAKLNAMALHKRLCSSGRWLEALCAHVLSELQIVLGQQATHDYGGLRLRILDATDVQEPGSTGTDWRVHYSIRLPELSCDFFTITDKHTAETLLHLPVEPGDLVLVDRGYSDRKAVGQVMRLGGQVIMRYNSGAFPLQDERGRKLDPLDKLRHLTLGQAAEQEVYFQTLAGGVAQKARLCALRKSPEQTLRNQVKIRARASRSGVNVRQRTLDFAEFIVVLTTVEAHQISTGAVLEIYRGRWQIELAFKRLKSLLQLGQLPKSNPASSQAWMQGKILTALLIERQLCEARFLSPWGYPFGPDIPVDTIQRVP